MNRTDISSLLTETLGLGPTSLVGIAGAALLAGLLLAILSIRRSSRLRTELALEAARREAAAEARLSELLKAQAEMHGRLAAMSDVFGKRQSELNQAISQRLDGMTHRIGATIDRKSVV